METRRIKSTSKLVTAILYGSLMGLVVLFSLGNAERSSRKHGATMEQMRGAEAAPVTSDATDQASSQRQIPGHPELDLQLD